MKDNNQNFSASQQEAICHGKGPALVLAGPGSGKTTVLTHRLQYLITTLRVQPQKILVVTFTKAAAEEMQKRFEILVNQKLPVTFGTFHSIFYHILRNTKFPHQTNNPITILTEKEKTDFLQHILKQEEIAEELLPQIISQMAKIKNGISAEENGEGILEQEFLQKIMHAYRERCTEEGKIDFDDMAYECLRLLEAHSDLLRLWQKRYAYILVDEYQDIGPIQQKILELLALPENNLFLVGDDDQSVYGFRGAGTEIMLSFPEKYPNGKQIYLDMNYRSRAEIVTFAGEIIAANKHRFAKKQQPVRNCAEEKAVIIKGFEGYEEENRWIAEQLSLLQKGNRLHSCAVLFRTHADSEKLIWELEKKGIPYVRQGKQKSVFEHFITEDMTAYMKLLCGDTSRENFYKIMNRPKRGLDRDCCPYENNTLEQIKEYYRRDAERMDAIKRLQKDCQMARQMKPYAAVMYIRKKMGYEKWLLENTKEALLEEHMQILTLMQELSRQICTIDEWVAFIKSRSESYKGKDGNKEKGVLIATYHGSKGLEFDTVFMPDINEGKTPHRKAVSEKEIEEERRMYYVGITRAKEQLNLYYRTGTKEEPEQISRFLKDYI